MRTGMYLLGIGLGLFAAEATIPEVRSGYTDLTALAAVIAALGYLLKFHIPKIMADAKEEREKTVANFTSTLDKIAERHDGWEKLRHADHEAQQETLREMTRQCANVHTQIQERANERAYPTGHGMEPSGH